MPEIPNDLIKFKETVGPSIGAMSGAASDISRSISNVLKYTTTAKNGLDSNYSSSKKSILISTFDSLNTTCSNVINGVEGDLSSILSTSSSLVGKVSELESLNGVIASLQAAANSGEDSDSKSLAKSRLANKLKEFDNNLEAAKSMLIALKGYGGTISSGSSAAGEEKQNGEEAPPITNKMTGKSFELEDFVVNGKTMKCLVYRPSYSGEVEKLPITMYMYGMDFKNHGTNLMTNGGLGKLIKENVVSPNGIVVIPYVQNGRQYENKEFRDQLAQLPLEVAKKYNGDTDRISLSGTSYGAVTSYRLVNEHPGEFSAIMAAYGAGDITSAFKGMKVINYTGQGGKNHPNINYIKNATNQINAIGGYATFHDYKGTWNHTNVGTMAFGEKNSKGQYLIDELLSWKKSS